MEDRNEQHEKRIKAYLFKGDVNRFIKICENLSILNNLAILNEFKEMKGGLKE